MKPRGNCLECHLRDATHTVTEPDRTPVALCDHCASAYDPRFVIRFAPRP